MGCGVVIPLPILRLTRMTRLYRYPPPNPIKMCSYYISHNYAVVEVELVDVDVVDVDVDVVVSNAPIRQTPV